MTTSFLAVSVLVCLTSLRGSASMYMQEDVITQTVHPSVTNFQFIPTTGAESGVLTPEDVATTPASQRGTGGNTTDHDHHSGQSEECKADREWCNTNVVRRCADHIFDRMMRPDTDSDDDTDYPTGEKSDFPCSCAFHCFSHFGRACYSLRRQIKELRKQNGDKHEDVQHSVLNHLGELIGTFGTGVVVGVLVTLLIVVLMRRCATTETNSTPREFRSDSSAGLPISLRAPMPNPTPPPSGPYSVSPNLIESHKIDRTRWKGVGEYEDVDGSEFLDRRPQSKESGQNVYFVLENEGRRNRNDAVDGQDADNMPSDDGQRQRVSSSPDVVPETPSGSSAGVARTKSDKDCGEVETRVSKL